MIALAALLLMSQRAIFADGAWAAFDRRQSCVAISRSNRIVADRSQQANAGFTFDRGGPRRGQFAARLSHPLRPDSSVILTIGTSPFLLIANGSFAFSRGPAQEAAIMAAARTGASMRVEARAPGFGRFVDSFSLDGAPGAIDAAAACSAGRKAVTPLE